MSISVPPHIADLHAYVPGKPVKEVERELGLTSTVKMASNENPLGPSPRALEAARRCLDDIHIYPEGSGFYLCKALSAHFSVPEEQIILGNGSVEIIEIAAKALVGPGRNAVISEGAFAMFSIACKAMGAPVKEIPMRDRTHDLEAMEAAIDGDTRLVFVANPNNPTGTYVPLRLVERFLERVPPDVLVILDEAYKEFVESPDYGSAQPLMERFPNLMCLGTFSKLHGLAALRIGYGFAQPEVISFLHKVRSPFNTNSLAQMAAMAALEDREFAERYIALNRIEREFICRELQGMGLRITPTVTNFVLLDVPISGKDFFEKLLREGFIVRPMAGSGFPSSVRVTFHLREYNERFLEATKKVLGL